MDEKMFALVGAVAGVTVAGRGLRPVAKLALRGVVAAADATSAARRELAELYAEAKADHRGGEPDAVPGSASAPA
ncbi:MAG: hypothetical protein M3N47_10655 [Chloroflexota bacterium]|nr:hypothetical protein [Chloroflexota bacterium]